VYFYQFIMHFDEKRDKSAYYQRYNKAKYRARNKI